MPDLGRSARPFDDAPLFVLKYRRYKVALRTVFYLIFVPFFGIGAFLIPLKPGIMHMVSRVALGIIFFLMLFQLVDLLLFKEIRLYKDSVLKVWKLIGGRERRLASARLAGRTIFPYSLKVISDQNSSRFLAPFNGILYDENLADRKDVRRLTSLLAELSGRKVEDFQGTSIRMKKLIAE